MSTERGRDPLIGRIKGRKVYEYQLLDVFGNPIGLPQRFVANTFEERDAFMLKMVEKEYKDYLRGKKDKNGEVYPFILKGWEYVIVADERRLKQTGDFIPWSGEGLFSHDSIDSYYFRLDLLGRAHYKEDRLVPNSLKRLVDLPPGVYYEVTGKAKPKNLK